MGTHGEESYNCFLCNRGGWGSMGRKRVSLLKMGTEGGVGGAQSAPIAVIADIARDRKGKTLPRINTDNTDQKRQQQAGHRVIGTSGKRIIGKAKAFTT